LQKRIVGQNRLFDCDTFADGILNQVVHGTLNSVFVEKNEEVEYLHPDF
jgi:hypothetical protein